MRRKCTPSTQSSRVCVACHCHLIRLCWKAVWLMRAILLFSIPLKSERSTLGTLRWRRLNEFIDGGHDLRWHSVESDSGSINLGCSAMNHIELSYIWVRVVGVNLRHAWLRYVLDQYARAGPCFDHGVRPTVGGVGDALGECRRFIGVPPSVMVDGATNPASNRSRGACSNGSPSNSQGQGWSRAWLDEGNKSDDREDAGGGVPVHHDSRMTETSRLSFWKVKIRVYIFWNSWNTVRIFFLDLFFLIENCRIERRVARKSWRR